MTVKSGEISCIVGSNGSGKSTLLGILSGVYKPIRGKVNGTKLQNTRGRIVMMPQNPKAMFSHDSIKEELYKASGESKNSYLTVSEIAKKMNIDHLLDSHPYDVSLGELQRAAFAKVMLISPDIVLLDEPTKGIDAPHKQILADIISGMAKNGVAFVIVTHDLEFAAGIADSCGMIFAGVCSGQDETVNFFDKNHFYTTAVNRITRAHIPGCITVKDVCDNAEII